MDPTEPSEGEKWGDLEGVKNKESHKALMMGWQSMRNLLCFLPLVNRYSRHHTLCYCPSQSVVGHSVEITLVEGQRNQPHIRNRHLPIESHHWAAVFAVWVLDSPSYSLGRDQPICHENWLLKGGFDSYKHFTPQQCACCETGHMIAQVVREEQPFVLP